ncbi:MAG: hypothetical protein HN729_12665 [Candidatus Marinimicrobia bacterium]|jgi:hypothetical protein|nr:hypothetical protein [Candidatus Neomarinimicrobiota bacterium]MBT3634670.1 hypothetical protein [Candidatus Neomarinimicrobiota bacterium]MBT3682700.1 hypothetical protein [Candidatus Neomarinimicrobiota bacterium]MBT3759645.1 hypothetical protein [Candidatus Neomarinimicrobiota bacterium]MBT3894483.1 hypothetical protein [Candidatus Neomarinimicrobiota bacterium]
MVKLNKDHKARIENILNDISNIKKIYGTGISGKMENNLIREIGEFSGSVDNIINEKLNIPKNKDKSSSDENNSNEKSVAMPSFMNKYYRSK